MFQYLRKLFGADNSLTSGNYELQRTTADNAVEYPETSQGLPQNFQVDIFLESSETLEQTEKLSNPCKFVNFTCL